MRNYKSSSSSPFYVHSFLACTGRTDNYWSEMLATAALLCYTISSVTSTVVVAWLALI